MGEHRWRGSSRPTGTGPTAPVSTARPTRARRAIVAAALTVAAGLGGAGAALAAPSDPPAAAAPTASPSVPPDGRALRADLPLVGTAPHSATHAPASTRAADPAPPTTTRSTTAPPTTTPTTTTPTGLTPTTTTRTTAAPAPARPQGVAGTPCTATARACVDLASRTAWLLDGDQVVRGPVAVQHGGHEYPTPVGTFTVQWKAEQYTSREFGSPMPYSVFFAPGGVAFHEGRQDTPSAGCVKLVHDDAVAWFSYLQVGDEVQIH
ncbi:L,D-transpeptidase [Pseudonocardia dioxanivorans]|uniref:L,D-transpeptidase n=1 Tax=Pseudonocardia dioxanivorans TaxID=240495 RepID=UPI000D02CFD5|nr:L,D-transpeptidase [Pseudonocardia dioxanivorans]